MDPTEARTIIINTIYRRTPPPGGAITTDSFKAWESEISRNISKECASHAADAQISPVVR